jgi:hypothetical protein
VTPGVCVGYATGRERLRGAEPKLQHGELRCTCGDNVYFMQPREFRGGVRADGVSAVQHGELHDEDRGKRVHAVHTRDVHGEDRGVSWVSNVRIRMVRVRAGEHGVRRVSARDVLGRVYRGHV